jgi:hypothetical protein
LTPASQTARATASFPDKRSRLAAGAGITAAMITPDSYAKPTIIEGSSGGHLIQRKSFRFLFLFHIFFTKKRLRENTDIAQCEFAFYNVQRDIGVNTGSPTNLKALKLSG